MPSRNPTSLCPRTFEHTLAVLLLAGAALWQRVRESIFPEYGKPRQQMWRKCGSTECQSEHPPPCRPKPVTFAIFYRGLSGVR